MTINFSSLSTQVDTWPNSTVARLAAFVGTWDIVMIFPGDDTPFTGGQAIFEWHDHGYFLIERSHAGSDEFPKGYSITGGDDSLGSYTQLQYDSRGISRLYQMSLDDKEWKLWRNAPGFYQRFTGTFSNDGKIITGFSERSEDGTTWELDFDITYTKAG